MLVLTRKPGEQFVVADNVIITVLEICGGRIRLGVEAPADVPIWRGELVPAAEHETKPRGSKAHARWRPAPKG
jgi:carbon storage regulator